MPLTSAAGELESRGSELDSRGPERSLGLVSGPNAVKTPTPPLAARILQSQATVLSQKTFAGAAAAFATDIASVLRFDRAAVGFSIRGAMRVVATSHTADFQPNGELFNAFGAAMDEALDQCCTVAYPSVPGARPLVALAHAELGRRYGGAVCTIPLVSHGHIFGAVTLVRSDGPLTGPDEITLCEHLACIVGPILELKWQSERSWHARLLAAVGRHAHRLVEPGNAALKAGAAAAAIAMVVLLFVPVQYRIGAQARIEGSIQRALVAPGDGFLRTVHVRPGDRVKAGQVVAELAGEDLSNERRKQESELVQHENAASAALARSDRAQFVIEQGKADEARAQLDLIQSQLSRARIIAPFDGVVIKGDLSQSVGAPVRRGEVLITIAPVDQFRLLVEVDERDIALIRAGAHGTLALGAFAERSLPFRVERITPVAVAREGRNFFEVEGKLENSISTLRPGLQGVAKIGAGERTLGWAWTHRVLDWLRIALWSWGI